MYPEARCESSLNLNGLQRFEVFCNFLLSNLLCQLQGRLLTQTIETRPWSQLLAFTQSLFLVTRPANDQKNQNQFSTFPDGKRSNTEYSKSKFKLNLGIAVTVRIIYCHDFLQVDQSTTGGVSIRDRPNSCLDLHHFPSSS